VYKQQYEPKVPDTMVCKKRGTTFDSNLSVGFYIALVQKNVTSNNWA
jgi:hypothetical protein